MAALRETPWANQNWADVDDDDEHMPMKANVIETAVNDKGIKTVTTYEERDGQSYKIERRVKVTTKEVRVNKNVKARENLINAKFGVDADAEEAAKWNAILSPEEVHIEATKRLWGVQQDEMDKFFEQEAENAIASRRKEGGGGAWKSTAQRREDGDMPDMPGDEKIATDANSRDASGKYIPPSLRRAGGGTMDRDEREEFTLRVTNLSEDCKEGDLHELFGQFGRLTRVFLAKNKETNESKGFAFINFMVKRDAERAIEKLNGHGYDNLILGVSFAQQRKPGQ